MSEGSPRAYGPGGVKRSSKREDWRTPPWLFEMLDDEFGGFELDAAAQSKNALCPRFIAPRTDGLHVDWRDPRIYSIRPDIVAAVRAGEMDISILRPSAKRVYVNPPWSRKKPIGPWIRKMVVQSKTRGQLVVANVPANTDVAWWHDYVLPYADEIRMVKGRIKYGDPDTGEESQGAPMGTAVLVYRPHVPIYGVITQPHQVGKRYRPKVPTGGRG